MKFTIRDLLLVTVIVALAVGWWVDRSRLSHELERFSDSIHAPTIHEIQIDDTFNLVPK